MNTVRVAISQPHPLPDIVFWQCHSERLGVSHHKLGMFGHCDGGCWAVEAELRCLRQHTRSTIATGERKKHLVVDDAPGVGDAVVVLVREGVVPRARRAEGVAADVQLAVVRARLPDVVRRQRRQSAAQTVACIDSDSASRTVRIEHRRAHQAPVSLPSKAGA